MPNAVNPLSILKSSFGYDSFWRPQEEIIHDVLAKRDVLAVMPTGGGKSLCYQLPSLIFRGVTLVVSPLIALMKDQVDALNANGIPSRFINSSLTYQESLRVQREVRDGTVKLLYVAPERLPIPGFRRLLRDIDLSLIAIDEAHCISEWGHEFRPDYRNLLELRKSFPSTPVIALTATATERVRDDIMDQLGIGKDRMYISSFNRSNLSYWVRPRNRNVYGELNSLVESRRGHSTIIYCFSRRDTEELASYLNANGFSALPYHAGLDAETRRKTQDDFIQDRVPIITATIAFGMGIDKPDVRLVVHYSLPKSIEAYYQETGRAGRDGLPSDCVIFFSLADRVKQEYFIRQMEDDIEQRNARQKLDKMVEYAQTPTCRRRFLLGYFGEDWKEESCGGCDVCLQPGKTFDATEVAQKVLSAVARTGERFGTNYVVDVLVGSKNKRISTDGHDKLSVYGIVKDFSKAQLKELVGQLQSKGLLVRRNDDYPTLALSEAGWKFLRERQTIFLARPAVEGKQQRRSSSVDPVKFDQGLFEKLRVLRRDLAEEHNVPPYVVFGDVSLRQMAAIYPQNANEFSDIHGVGRLKLEEYGEKFTSVIRDYVRANNITVYRAANHRRTSNDLRRDTYRSYLSPTHKNTRQLLDEGLNLEEIASRRGLTRTTIVGHIEHIAASGVFVDVSHMAPSGSRLVEIETAFRENGNTLLGPVKERLGDSIDYEELRLARVYLNQQKGLSKS